MSDRVPKCFAGYQHGAIGCPIGCRNASLATLLSAAVCAKCFAGYRVGCDRVSDRVRKCFAGYQIGWTIGCRSELDRVSKAPKCFAGYHLGEVACTVGFPIGCRNALLATTISRTTRRRSGAGSGVESAKCFAG